MTKLNYQIKKLTTQDLDPKKGYLKTLSYLSFVGDINQKQAEKILEKINKQNSIIFIAEKDDGQIIASVTLLLEQKFLRGGKLAGHIEDAVTRKEYEGQGIASALIKKAIATAKAKGCYKIVLDCDKKLIPFYKKFGLKDQEVGMKKYLK